MQICWVLMPVFFCTKVILLLNLGMSKSLQLGLQLLCGPGLSAGQHQPVMFGIFLS